ncbi:MAG TPA: hypothetical protein IAC31_02995 [Candidatus Faecousia intestinigallinarum]|nr:hypothetical protein [Candidatus Faecousia intestinigallinarum]
MEREAVFSGYCRCLDGSRMVAVEIGENGCADVGCGYADCPYAAGCPIGQKITAFLSE